MIIIIRYIEYTCEQTPILCQNYFSVLHMLSLNIITIMLIIEHG